MANMNIESEIETSSDYNSSPTIYLSDDQCEALGITDAPQPGTVYMLKVRAVATRVTAEIEESDEAETEGSKPDVCLTLQLTDIEITSGGGKPAASLLYGD